MQRIARSLFGMQRQSTFDDRRLVANPFGVQPGARPDQQRRCAFQQGTGDSTGRRSIADAHLTADKQLAASGLGPQHAVTPARHGQQPLLDSHRRTLGKVGRTGANVQVANTRQIQRRDRAEIDHVQLRRQLFGQYADGRAAHDEVVQHLPGHFLGIGRHAFSDDTVVTGENRDPALIHSRLFPTLQTSQLAPPLARAGRGSRLVWSIAADGPMRLRASVHSAPEQV